MKKEVKKIVQDIKSIKIQGATNIAKAALKAFLLEPTTEVKKALMHARPTEPMLVNVIHSIDKCYHKEKHLCLNTPLHFNNAQEKINKLVFKIIKNHYVIYTHCHSTNVVKALVYAKKHTKRFEVYNTETRPLFQGRKTALELEKAGIKVTTFVDAAVAIALEKKQGTKKADFVLIGSDAILKDGVINKVGSGLIAELAFLHKIPLYIVSDSWKFFPKHVKIEERDFHEIWKNAPKDIKVRNPAFEFVEKKYIRAVISELGILKFDEFVKRAKKSIQ
jgi:translation initiation factor 2B subunit (eIF-2B alpha/beta/delta family)